MNFKSNLMLEDLIGAGYFGKVYKCEDELHGSVAAKIMSQKPAESPADWEIRKNALLSEARHLKRANDLNVVPVHYVVYKNGTNVAVEGEELDQISTHGDDEENLADSILLVMKLCSGGSLQTICENGPSNLDFVRKVATQVTLGLQALHNKEMLHRDIKPGNILIDDDGSAKLADFGLVTDEIVYGYAEAAGYLDHLAFEVHAGAGTSVKSDIWALGVTIYRLLHGEEWYNSAPRPVDQVAKGGFARTLNWLPHIPPKWRRMVNKMLNDDPGARYQSTYQVLQALADLPIAPCFDCAIGDNGVIWTTTKKSRRVTVEWEQISDRKHKWTATSAPTNGIGRQKKLGGSAKVIGKRQVLSELDRFFREQK